ncbi:MAG: nitrogenase iron-molybdenum cofactor biosynthesis protein NifN, partial [Gammaproteobacteria bacterium]
ASLAFLGVRNAIPMMHGSQGCTAFGKVFFVRHFREPIPLQTTAMDQVAAVMGSEDNVVTGLKTICEKQSPSLIGLPSTGLSETQGSDLRMAVGEFRKKHPEYDHIPVIPVSTPDFSGCFESGFALAVEALINELVPKAEDAATKPGNRPKQVNLLVSSSLTPGDLEVLVEWCELFGLRPVMIPDVGDALDGHLTDEQFNPLTVGGLLVEEFKTLGDSVATIVIGDSLHKAADLLQQRTGVPDHRFTHLMGLEANDKLVMALSEIAGQPVPPRLERQRSQLQDAMLDSHFMIGQTRAALAGDPDMIIGMSEFLSAMGAEVVAAVAPANARILKQAPTAEVKIGDLEDLELMATANQAEILIGNSHCVAAAERLGIPLLRNGFPQYDLVGGYARAWIGYRGARQALYDLANILLTLERGEIHPYRSVLAQKRDEAFQAEFSERRQARLGLH